MRVRIQELGRSLAALATIGVLGGAPAAVAAPRPVSESKAEETLAEVGREVAQIERDMDVVARGYGAPLDLPTDGAVDRRMREGEVHFLLNDYLRASIVLYDVVDEPRNASHPRIDDATYFLAESLRRTGHVTAARAYFERLLPRVSGDRLRDTVVALLEIASATGRYDGVDAAVARLRDAGSMSRPDVDYIHGKMLFAGASGDAGGLESALARFKAVGDGAPVSPQAAYYAGVVLVALGRLDAAVPEFQTAARRARAAGESGSAIRELAQLALGRLHYEQGRTSEAVDAYQEIAVESPHFSDMLFEVAWTHVRAANSSTVAETREQNLSLALRMSELLMASAPGPRLFPEARILEGNLQIRLGAPETAYDTFESVIDRYGGARDKLSELLDTLGDPKAFFDQIVAEDVKTVRSTSFLPPVAIEWAVRSPEVRRAVSMMQDVRRSRQDLDETRELIRTLTDALKGEQRYKMFPGLHEARNRAFGIENQLVLLNRRLLNLERQMVLPYANETAVAGLDAMAARRRAIEEEVQKLPQTTDEVTAASADIEAQYGAVDRRVFRQSYQIASMRAQVAAVEVWLARTRPSLSDEQIRLMTERVATARSELAALESETETLASDVRTARAISGADGGRVRAQRVREAYSQVMSKEFEMLAALRGDMPGDLRGLAPRLDSERRRLSELSAGLSKLQRSLDSQIDTKVGAIQDEIARELERVTSYEGQHGELSKAADGMLGPLAESSLRSVLGEFNNLVRRADVGIIDVAWARKQLESTKVNDLVQKQQSQLQELDVEFADVLEDE